MSKPQKMTPRLKLIEVLRLIRIEAESDDESAQCLRREVKHGIYRRQSPEEKMARVAVLESHRDWARRILKTFDTP